jgi:hypothetical protein
MNPQGSIQPIEERLACSDNPSRERHDFWITQVHQIRHTQRHCSAVVIKHFKNRRPLVIGDLCTQSVQHRFTGGKRRFRGRERVHSSRGQRFFDQTTKSITGGAEFPASRLPAHATRTIRVDHHMAKLRGKPIRTPNKLSAKDHSATDAGAKGDHDEGIGGGLVTLVRRPCPAVGVIVDTNRYAKSLRDCRSNVVANDVLQVRRLARNAVESDVAREPKTDSVELGDNAIEGDRLARCRSAPHQSLH